MTCAARYRQKSNVYRGLTPATLRVLAEYGYSDDEIKAIELADKQKFEANKEKRLKQRRK